MSKPRCRFTLEPVVLAAALCAIVAPVTVPTAGAAAFGVRVVDARGEPVPGAAVCIGLEGNHRQFGAEFTDIDGRATVDVPDVPLVVTVSKTRFAGVRMAEPARGFDLIGQVRLVDGVPGPRCRADSTVAEPGHGLVEIREVAVRTGGGLPTMTARATGRPTHYRVGPSSELGKAAWQRFADTIPVPGSLADASTVYLQLRRYAGTPRAWIEARSDVAAVRMPVR